jgi:hypothetical protein
MTRTITDPPNASRGSRKWLQVLVNCRPELLNDAVAQCLHELPDDIDWRSPLWEDHYAEYRDQTFLDRLSGSMYFRAPARPQQELTDFWPRFGPQWDGLAVTDRGQVLLVEAKAHIPEIVTAPSQARGESAIQKIQQSLGRVKTFVNSRAPVDWSTSFYQYANRLAHLYWMREINGHDAYLVNLFFINDREMNGPASVAEWQAAIRLQEVFLGVRQASQVSYALDPWVGAYSLDVFIDVNEISVLYPPPI